MAFSVAKAFIYALLQPLMRSYAQMINRNDIFKNVADVRKAVSAKVFEAMSNMNKVAFINDPRREATSVMLFMLALANAGRPEKVQDNQEPMYRSNPATDDYANMFKIGKEKYQNLVQYNY